MRRQSRELLVRAARAMAMAACSGVLLWLSLSPHDIEWLAWFALVPLLLATHNARPLYAVLLVMLTCGLCGLLQVGLATDAEPLLPGFVPFLWLALLFGVITTVAAAVRRSRGPGGGKGMHWVVIVAATAVVAEWLTTFSPLPLHYALSQYRALPVIQIAAFSGIWGVSFLLWWTNAAIADALLERRVPTTSHITSATALMIAVAFGSFELWRLGEPEAPLPKVAAIQGAFGRARQQMTREAAKQGALFIVWPEVSLGDSFHPDDPRDPTRVLARDLGTHIVVGYYDLSNGHRYNCAALISPDGTIAGVHHKIHPYSDERGRIEPGRNATVCDTAWGRIGLEICYDSCFPAVTRDTVSKGAVLIAMPNHDPPVRAGVLHRFHAAFLPFRAIENRVAFVRADTSGLSQIVEPSGRIVAQSPPAGAHLLIARVHYGDGRGTLFTRYGDWLVYACALLLLAQIGCAVRGRRSPKRASDELI